ncbi:DUF4384 domain-containing protein [Rhizobacter sp. AJA081-3]|uniref:DUF4384 domain-containing protein n=1 Tax=Rhizobacter sp. AJA081-3 TaxID=2753607 RepID=UPI001ADFA7E0|nr:DUF4384 domain-containing protein [Rhizobacter sp. AJA081-3]QTN22201.1 DUF4384 domain-containing protein [Rhizobacter sp. AJA081-3]
MSTLKTLAALLVSGITLAPVAGLAQQATDDLGAKALFYNASGAVVSVPSKTSAPPKEVVAAPRKAPPVLALRASVLLVAADGGTREVKPSHAFKTGDRIKLSFAANRSGFFYLATVGSSGKVQILAPRRGEPATLEAGYRYQYPASPTGYFKFDGAPGKEVLWAVLADEPLTAIDLGEGRIAQVQRAEGSTPVQQSVASVANEFAGKDLVFEEDSEAAYASVKPSAMKPGGTPAKPKVMVRLVLDHQ